MIMNVSIIKYLVNNEIKLKSFIISKALRITFLKLNKRLAENFHNIVIEKHKTEHHF